LAIDHEDHLSVLSGQRIEYPPSTTIVVPVTKSDARDARNTAAPASSSAWPHRPAGVRNMISSCIAGIVFIGAVISVSNHPGAIAFT
jgi:hypothetical protein